MTTQFLIACSNKKRAWKIFDVSEIKIQQIFSEKNINLAKSD